MPQPILCYTQLMRKYALKPENAKVVEALKSNPDLSYKAIALSLGRTVGEVASLARRNGLQHGRTGRRRFTYLSNRRKRTVKEQRILEFVQAHPDFTYPEIAANFRVPSHIVSSLVYRSGFRRSAVTPEHKEKEKQVAEYIAAHPEQSYSDMGRTLGLPSLRIANIARKFGMFRGKGHGPRHNQGGREGRSYPRTEAEKEHLSKAMTALWARVPSTHKKRIGQITKGAWTPEQRAKLSRALKQVWKIILQ